MEHAQIRLADMEDAAEINRLSGQLGYPNTLDEMVHRLEVILADSSQALFTIELDDHKTLGYIHVAKKVSLEVGIVIEVNALVINSDYRRRGLGRLLMEKAEEWATAMDSPMIRLHSNVIRAEAHRFYESLGYKITKTQHSFVKLLVE